MAGKGRQREQKAGKCVLPTFTAGIQSTDLLSLCTSLHFHWKHDTVVAHCFGAEMLMEGRSTVPLSYTKNLCWDVREKGSLIKNLHIERSGSNK